MNMLELLSLKPGTLFKGIDNRKHQSILNADGWNNIFTGSYGIRWFNTESFKDFQFKIFNHKTSTSEDRIAIYQQYHASLQNNFKLYKKSGQDIIFDVKTIQIGDPIGMFLGESIFCINGASDITVLLKILDNTKIGWIVLVYSHTNDQFNIY
jgi:hypothetical protein